MRGDSFERRSLGWDGNPSGVVLQEMVAKLSEAWQPGILDFPISWKFYRIATLWQAA